MTANTTTELLIPQQHAYSIVLLLLAVAASQSNGQWLTTEWKHALCSAVAQCFDTYSSLNCEHAQVPLRGLPYCRTAVGNAHRAYVALAVVCVLRQRYLTTTLMQLQRRGLRHVIQCQLQVCISSAQHKDQCAVTALAWFDNQLQTLNNAETNQVIHSNDAQQH
eukprot:16107-Heterococcus_DN1.PRE.2